MHTPRYHKNRALKPRQVEKSSVIRASARFMPEQNTPDYVDSMVNRGFISHEQGIAIKLVTTASAFKKYCEDFGVESLGLERSE